MNETCAVANSKGQNEIKILSTPAIIFLKTSSSMAGGGLLF